MKRLLFLLALFLFIFNGLSLSGECSSAEFLQQAIVKDSVEDIKKAIQAGADINQGIGQIPPLLSAVLLEKDNAVKELLNNGSNPNISYQNSPLLLYLLRHLKIELGLKFVQAGLKLSDVEKQAVVNHMLFNTFYRPDQSYFDILSRIGYDVKDNFENSDLSKNKWYNLLVKHPLGYKNGKPFGYSGLPAVNQIKLFIENGANPNHIFILPDGSTFTPLLLIIDSYLAACKWGSISGFINESYYQKTTKDLLTVLLNASVNINQHANPISKEKEDSALSMVLTGEGNMLGITRKINQGRLYTSTRKANLGFIIEFLIHNKALVEEAVSLYLKNGGLPDKEIGGNKILFWAIEKNNVKVVKILIDAGAQVTEQFLKRALEIGNPDIIKFITEALNYSI